jgi:hypothetical protein
VYQSLRIVLAPWGVRNFTQTVLHPSHRGCTRGRGVSKASKMEDSVKNIREKLFSQRQAVSSAE